jgi:hypothetical protein
MNDAKDLPGISLGNISVDPLKLRLLYCCLSVPPKRILRMPRFPKKKKKKEEEEKKSIKKRKNGKEKERRQERQTNRKCKG